MRTRVCCCGALYAGCGRCANGNNCPRQELGHGHWHVALMHLQRMSPQTRGERYPRLRFDSLRRHCAELQRERNPPARHFVQSASSTRHEWAACKTRSEQQAPKTALAESTRLLGSGAATAASGTASFHAAVSGAAISTAAEAMTQPEPEEAPLIDDELSVAEYYN